MASEEEPQKPARLPLEAVAFSAALERKGSRGECPFCHANNWTTTPTDYAIAKVEGNAIIVDQAMPLRPLICNQCGFVRFHLPAVTMD
jgi:hypothetical protein